MKHLIFLAILCLTTSLASAQDFGKSLLSGSIGYSSGNNHYNSTQESHSNSFFINPKYGVFISSNLVIGASLVYYRQQNESFPIFFGSDTEGRLSKSINNSFSGGPFVRLYHPVNQQFAFFGQGTASFQYSKHKSFGGSDIPSESSYKGGNIDLSPGIVFFPSNTIGLEFSLGNIGYGYHKREDNENTAGQKSSGFNIGFGFNTLNIGISIYLGRVAGE